MTIHNNIRINYDGNAEIKNAFEYQGYTYTVIISGKDFNHCYYSGQVSDIIVAAKQAFESVVSQGTPPEKMRCILTDLSVVIQRSDDDDDNEEINNRSSIYQSFLLLKLFFETTTIGPAQILN